MSSELLKETLKKEREIRRKVKIGDENSVKNFSSVLYFAGQEFNQFSENNFGAENKVNLIDFSQLSNEQGEKIGEIIKGIFNEQKNKQLADDGNFPIIWFKNIDKIEKNSPLEKALLPIFDFQQNTELFGKEVNLSKYILIATSSTREIGQFSLPLSSRLEVINVSTAKPRQLFLDKYFAWVLVGSVLLSIILGLLAFWPGKEKSEEK